MEPDTAESPTAETMTNLAEQTPSVSSAGTVVDRVAVTIGPRFLELFSENLYPSPNKAFEELISNSWDAGAQTVYIGVPDDLSSDAAVVWVLDDGESMDIAGFKALWAVATSQKRKESPRNGRMQIGKFGIGKLATYILANELTYICKASDGVIRAITMDYRRIDAESNEALHIENIPLNVRVLDPDELKSLLSTFGPGFEINALIESGVPKPGPSNEIDDEFGGVDVPPTITGGTWTLVLLTSLKPAGKAMQLGWIRRLLRSALPLGTSIAIIFNGEPLVTSKPETEVAAEWEIGPNLGISALEIRIGEAVETRTVTGHSSPYPHITIEGLEGVVTGRVRLYEDKISGGKSETLAPSNGFFVSILRRVINLDDPYFGLEDLNHSAWAKFRATIRADGLDKVIGVNRTDIIHGPELTIFQALLRALFNKARQVEVARQAEMPSAGEILTRAWGVLPLQPLSRVVAESLSANGVVPDFLDFSGVTNKEQALSQWQDSARENPGDLISNIELVSLPPDSPLVTYDFSTRRVLVNENHPFSREHIESDELQSLLRDTAFADLLTRTRMLDLGIDSGLVDEVWSYRDKTLRLLSQVNRRTGAQIAQLLLDTTNHIKGLEAATGDALEHLGFFVKRLAQSGQPEGVATAPTPPAQNDTASSYSFTYDAKSSKNGVVKTKDLSIAGLVRHRKNHKANHILVVAPDYEAGALQEECVANDVTPMRAADLAELLMLKVGAGPFNLVEFEQVFALYDPDDVHRWVKDFSAKVQKSERLPLDIFLAALAEIGYDGPNSITTSVIADHISRLPGVALKPIRQSIRKLVDGLSVLVPSLIQISNDDVFLTTSPQKLREAIITQISAVPPAYRPPFDLATTELVSDSGY